jgi:lipopolysaccharide transport protein LptA
VKAWQEKNTVLSQELQVQGDGDSIVARGNVRTLIYNSGAETRKTPMQTRSEQLVARRNDRRIDLLGNVSIQDEERSLRAEKATLFGDENRKVQRMEAENGVSMSEAASGRKGAGDKVVYQVDKKMMYLYGKPATITDPSGSLSGEQIVFDVARNRVRVPGSLKGTYKSEG